ncbi:MAG TPA: histone deacetylase family protein [Burkholderiaceae bacterium]|nr:histone deacetylase family protein [Burkholderiaceae bacterium]
MDTLYITHPTFGLHEMGAFHPECPARLDAIDDQLLSSGLINYLDHGQPRDATDTDLLRVHSAAYLAQLVRQAPDRGHFSIDPDTIMNPQTLAAARLAAGAGLEAVDALMRGDHRVAFCAVRPPGHHATPDRAMGFCFYNNIALAAAYALDVHGLERVAIIDFDVHHGNGTEDAFAHDHRTLMCSFYQYPFYPGVRHEPAADNMVNVAVPAGTSGTELRELVHDVWMPRLRQFAPEMVFISAGFDAHREEQLGQLAMVEDDYAWITTQLVSLADATARGRIVSMLEGGYELSALGRSVVAHVKALSKL